MHLICQMRRRFSVLKRGVLSHTFVWKLKIAVNLFTKIVNILPLLILTIDLSYIVLRISMHTVALLDATKAVTAGIKEILQTLEGEARQQAPGCTEGGGHVTILSSSPSASGSTFYPLDPLSDIGGTILELDAVGLAAGEKFHRVLVDEGHVPQIQNQRLPRCLQGEQVSEPLDIFCFNSATEREDDPAIG